MVCIGTNALAVTGANEPERRNGVKPSARRGPRPAARRCCLVAKAAVSIRQQPLSARSGSRAGVTGSGVKRQCALAPKLPLGSRRAGATSPRRYLCRSVTVLATARAPHSAKCGHRPPCTPKSGLAGQPLLDELSRDRVRWRRRSPSSSTDSSQPLLSLPAAASWSRWNQPATLSLRRPGDLAGGVGRGEPKHLRGVEPQRLSTVVGGGAELYACFLAVFPDDASSSVSPGRHEAGGHRIPPGRPAGLAAAEHTVAVDKRDHARVQAGVLLGVARSGMSASRGLRRSPTRRRRWRTTDARDARLGRSRLGEQPCRARRHSCYRTCWIDKTPFCTMPVFSALCRAYSSEDFGHR
jgi:hypothetical protein